ncbi:ABC transporter ATP-binding protein [Lutispora sp.]|uniref:ABC transporter ATP-binding protein n=1 Tax=Lutispora sp. TaxID=2828727 RepID=UPI0035690DB6
MKDKKEVSGVEYNEKLLEVRGLKKYFEKHKGIFRKKVEHVKAVDDVSFFINKKETFGLVGESGCGKSTTGRTIIRLYKPTSGKILYDGEDIGKLDEKDLMPYRKKIQMIFQDPYASLNTRMTVADIIGEPMEIHNIASGKEKEERIIELLNLVGLSKIHASRYPHEFSGGQRQRIGIARALSVNPEFIICDEPISALDVSIQAQVVNMLEDLQESFGLTYLFIAHDLSMVRHISDRIGVMYLGSLVEVADRNELYDNPIHPYTKALLSSIPIPDPELAEKTERIILEGDVPSPINPPSGCKFRTRCKYKSDICKETVPKLIDVGNKHYVACHLLQN